MKATRAPKARKVRAHASGISCKCKAGKCFDCSMLECQHECHETPPAEDFEPTFSPLPGVYGLP